MNMLELKKMLDERTNVVTDLLGLGAIAKAVSIPLLILVIGYLSGCP